MAVVTGSNGGFSMRDPLGFFAMLQSIAVGTSTSTQFTTQNTDASSQWVFNGTGFGAFSSNIPTTGNLTAINYTSSIGAVNIVITGISMTMERFFSYIANNNTTGLFSDMFAGDDTITGGNGNDNLVGYGGNDLIDGGLGADTLEGGSGINTLNGQDGDDQIFSAVSRDTLDGGAGTDLMAIARQQGTAGINLSIAGIGRSAFVDIGDGTLVRGFERISVSLSAGNDTLSISDTLGGTNVFEGGSGLDRLTWDMSGYTANLAMNTLASDRTRMFGFGNIFTLETFGVELFQLTGGSGSDSFIGLSGNDTLSGGLGNDTLTGGAGDDVLSGGQGNDSLEDGAGIGSVSGGNDTLAGGDGDDSIRGAEGNNVLSGEAGNDMITSGAHLLGGGGSGAVADVIDGGAGFDSLTIYRNNASVNLTFDVTAMTSAVGATLADGTIVRNIETILSAAGGLGNDTFIVNAGLFNPLLSPVVSLIFDGGAGTDRFVADFSTINIAISNSIGGWMFGSRTASIFVESIDMTTGSGNDSINGLIGDDIINGGAGNDTLSGGSGNDRLLGGEGDDRLILGSFGSQLGIDTLDGGSGYDIVEFNNEGATTGVTIDLSSPNPAGAVTLSDGTQLIGIEGVSGRFGNGNDTLIFARSATMGIGQNLFGGGGTDRMVIDLSLASERIRFSDSGLSIGAFAGSQNLIFSSFEQVQISGGSASDELRGFSGADTITGNDGDDFISGGGGADQLFGGTGNDQLFGGIGGIIDGGDGNDFGQLTGILDNTSRTITTSQLLSATGISVGATTIRNIESFGIDMGDGDDTLVVDTVLTGFNRFNGGAGFDRLVADFSYVNRSISVFGPSTSIRIPGANVFITDVTLEFYGDALSITGSSADDRLEGGGAADVFRGGLGNDFLRGFGGNDTIQGGVGNDSLDGMDGFDFVDYSDSGALVTIDLNPIAGTNGLQFARGGNAEGDVLAGFEGAIGSGFADTLIGSSNTNHLLGGGGNDTLIGGGSSDTLNGGDGVDLAGYRSATAGVHVSLVAGANNTGDATGDIFIGIEGLEGSGFADSLTGDAGGNYFWAGAGNDTILGGGGADILVGNEGADVLDGGDGFDFAVYDNATSGLTLFMGGGTFNTGEANGDAHISIEGLVGSNFSDIIGADANNNELRGLDGNDFIYGRGGVDTLLGGDGNDVLDGGFGGDQMDGGAGVDVAYYRDSTAGLSANLLTGVGTGDALGDTYVNIENIWGSDFNDVLAGDNNGGQVYGFLGNDNLSGLGGDDFFYGGDGADTIDGGAGVDNFFFLAWQDQTNQFGTLERAEGGDTFTDFTSGADRIILSRFWFGFGNIGGPAAALTETHANFVTNGAATTGRPSLIWNAGNRTLSFDADGNGATQAVLLGTLQAGATLTLGDIWTA